MAIITKDTPVGYELEGVKKQADIHLMGSRYWGRHNPLHWDPVYSVQQGLKAPIQTGMMSTSYIQEMLINFFGENFFKNAQLQVKYIHPVYAGDIITTYGVVREKVPEAKGYRFKLEVGAKNQDGEPVTIGSAEVNVK